MKNIIEWLSGKKTHILAGLGGVVVALWLAGVIDAELASQLLAVLGFGSVSALRSGVSKSAPRRD